MGYRLEKKMKNKQWALVTWRDSNIYSQQGVADGTKVAIIKTSGFLVSQDKDCVKIARDKIEELNEWRALIVIPKENIIKILF